MLQLWRLLRIYWAQQTGKLPTFYRCTSFKPILGDPVLMTIERGGIEHNDVSRHLMHSYLHLWRLTWGGCFNLGRMDILESMFWPPMLKSRQRQTSVRWTYIVSLLTCFLFFYLPFSNFRCPARRGSNPINRPLCLRCIYSTRADALCSIFSLSCNYYPSTRALPLYTSSLPSHLNPLLCENPLRHALHTIQVLPQPPILHCS